MQLIPSKNTCINRLRDILMGVSTPKFFDENSGAIISGLALGVIKTLKQLRKELRIFVTPDMLFFPWRGIDDVVEKWITESGIDKHLPEN